MVQIFSQSFSFPSVPFPLLSNLFTPPNPTHLSIYLSFYCFEPGQTRLHSVHSLTLSDPSFPHSHEWSKVIFGVWQKYPNPATAHVISVDTIGRTVDPTTGVVRTSVLFSSFFSLGGALGVCPHSFDVGFFLLFRERVIGCKQSAPVRVFSLFFPFFFFYLFGEEGFPSHSRPLPFSPP